ncbi:NAD(P)H-quinone oxidoreductase [Shewanella carassii]|uniref:Alcohol dehydrogenase n=2 Tax=Bacteria TaxID=2 RepID=A0ABQ1T8X1_9GAMM|nr:NAD(P)H-quinone oxidoreductase [Shewanella carassii]GGE83899.1 alcohol dehydrogenase [Shewanella carassii]
MKQVIFDNPGQPEVLYLADAKIPTPGPGQVLIKVAAAGVNGPDLAQRKGNYPPPADASPVLGLEVAGEIVALGQGVDQWQNGQDVCALVPGGGYSEYVLTWASHCLPVPKDWSLEEAAAIPETFFTVWSNLFMRAGLRFGETVLIHGGSGGIGSSAIALAKAFGARVLVTSSSPEKCAWCRQLGAELAVDYRQQDFVEAVMDWTQGKGVEVVLDMAGGDFVNKNLKLLACDGRMVSIAMQRGAKAEVDLFRLIAKRIVWTGSTLRPQSVAAKAAIAAELKAKVWPLLDKGMLKPHLFAQFPLEECIAAHHLLESGSHSGKVVLTLK